jgi:HAE1 family hydrophobic/amphiphilic exporter-1
VTPAQAIMRAASVRFRPIMMTSVASIVGTLPIAIGVGASAASRRPLGIAVVGGLVFSQIVTLYMAPVIYTYLDELQAWAGLSSTDSTAQSRAPIAGLGHGVPVAGD